MSDAPLRVACVGAGYFSRFHYASWARMPDVRLVGAADLNREAAMATGLPAFDSAEEMIRATRPDILDVILPPQAQAEVLRAGLHAGVPTIICQKPFCRSLDEALAFAGDAQCLGTNLIVHENFRFMPWYRAIREAISDGRIGTPMQAVFRLRPGDGQGPDAYLDRQPYFRQMPEFLVHETAVHWIDTFRFLFGTPTAVYADLRRRNPAIAGEDAGFVLFDHPGGVQCCFDGNRHLDHASDNLRRTMGEALFEGSGGSLTLFGDGRVEHRAFGARHGKVILPSDDSDGFGGDCVHHLQRHVVAAHRGAGEFENPAHDYCEVIRIRDAIYLSARERRKVDL